jgi:hypothetical protein
VAVKSNGLVDNTLFDAAAHRMFLLQVVVWIVVG